MSRAYRIKVSESLSRVIRASDHVSTQLELLDILPCDEMAEILVAQLAGLGFEQTENGLVRTTGDTKVTVDAQSGTVTVTSNAAQDVTLTSTQHTSVYQEQNKAARKDAEELARERALADIERSAEERTSELQKQVTDQLEAELVDVQQELGLAVNRATAEALKRKASRIGQIKEMSEDPESGSITIVLEV